jgi:hypothetical protein
MIYVVSRYREYRDSCGMWESIRTLWEAPAIHVKVSNHDVRPGKNESMISENSYLLNLRPTPQKFAGVKLFLYWSSAAQ